MLHSIIFFSFLFCFISCKTEVKSDLQSNCNQNLREKFQQEFQTSFSRSLQNDEFDSVYIETTINEMFGQLDLRKQTLINEIESIISADTFTLNEKHNLLESFQHKKFQEDYLIG